MPELLIREKLSRSVSSTLVAFLVKIVWHHYLLSSLKSNNQSLQIVQLMRVGLFVRLRELFELLLLDTKIVTADT